MKRAVLLISLILIACLFQACVPVTYTAYNANRYRLGRTLGEGKVHVTTSLATVPVIQNSGYSTGIVSTVLKGGALTFELTSALFDRTDLILSGGLGGWDTGSSQWGFAVQQQLTPRGEPFALSIMPGMTYVNGTRDDSNDDEWELTGYSSSVYSWIDSRMLVTELRVPMSYRADRYLELLWGGGLLYFDHRTEYGDNLGVRRRLVRGWFTPVGSMGIRLGFITLEASYLSFDGEPMTTLGGAFRFGF